MARKTFRDAQPVPNAKQPPKARKPRRNEGNARGKREQGTMPDRYERFKEFAQWAHGMGCYHVRDGDMEVVFERDSGRATSTFNPEIEETVRALEVVGFAEQPS